MGKVSSGGIYPGLDRASLLLERGCCSRVGLPGSVPMAAVLCPWQHAGQERWERPSEAALDVPRSIDRDQGLKQAQRAARRPFLSISREDFWLGGDSTPRLLPSAVLPRCGGGESPPCCLLSLPMHETTCLLWKPFLSCFLWSRSSLWTSPLARYAVASERWC